MKNSLVLFRKGVVCTKGGPVSGAPLTGAGRVIYQSVILGCASRQAGQTEAGQTSRQTAGERQAMLGVGLYVIRASVISCQLPRGFAPSAPESGQDLLVRG